LSVDIESIKKSYGRCLVSHGGKKKFFDHFYEIFLVSDPEVTEMFSRVDIAKQQVAIKRGISMMIMYAEDPESMAENLGRLPDGVTEGI
jgi:hemoglobin-like flavoprotein